MLNFIILKISQGLATSGQDTVNAIQLSRKDSGFIDLAVQGGLVMTLIVLLLFIAMYIFFNRYITIRQAGKIDSRLIGRIKEYVQDGKIESAFAICRTENTPTFRMIEKCISRIGYPKADIALAIENVGNLEVSKLEKGLPILASVVGGAPMLGLLGTVFGVIEAFVDMVNAESTVSMAVLVSGIYHALVPTAVGLIVGITAYFAYNLLVANVEKVVFEMEYTTSEFLEIIHE